MIAVQVEYNTDENNRWVYDERIAAGEDLPTTIHGPFDTVEQAEQWMQDYPDDTDVHDMFVVEKDFPEGWVINDPSATTGDTA